MIYLRQYRTKTIFCILCASCLHIFRHLAQFVLARRQPCCVLIVQSDEKSDFTIFTQSLCGIALIDFENVHSDGLKGIEQLSKKDKCYIFYSEHAGVLTFNMHKRITESKADIFYVEAQVGMKNALDFQLVSYLGYMIREAPEEDYCIISNDKAFELVGRFWQDKNVNVCSAVCLEQAKESGEHSRLHSELEKLITNSDELEFVEKCINELTTKSGINNRIVKKYGTTRAGEIYRLIKPLLTDKKGDKRQK